MKGKTMLKPLTLRPIRRQCFVPGCRNINGFIAARSKEMPVGVILCAACAKDIYRGLYPEESKAEEKAEPKEEGKETVPVIPEAPEPPKKTASRKKKAEEDKEA